mgnify:CR=1 FL=1
MENKQVILFDGDCNFCNYFVNYVIDRDTKDLFRFASLQSERGQELLNKYSLSQGLETVVLIKDDKARIKSSAALSIFIQLGWPYALVAPFWLVPWFIRDWFYGLVAKYRKQLMKNRSCVIPTESYKRKFIQ